MSPGARLEVLDLDPEFDLRPYLSPPEANRTVKDLFLANLRHEGATRNITVTDLLCSRKAYYRRMLPDFEGSMERSAQKMAGSGFHDLFSWRVSGEAYVEQKVNLQDITGRIDIYEERPLELKTTTAIYEAREVRRFRPSDLEQLGMYCATVDKPDGYLLYFNREEGRPLAGFEVHYDRLKNIKKEMFRRRDFLNEALRTKDPSNLPPCAFFGRGCEYQEQGACACTEGPGDDAFPIAALATLKRSPRLEEEFGRRFLEGAPEPPDAVTVNDLVYPQKAYHRRLRAQEEDEEDGKDVGGPLKATDSYGLMRELKHRGLGGIGGGIRRRRCELSEIRASVELHEGRVLRVSRRGIHSVPERWRLASLFPDAMLRLAFDAVLANTGKARIVFYYPNVLPEEQQIMVYDLTVSDLRPVRAEMLRRAALLKEARATGDPSKLPKCPSWMAQYCDYGPGCGCDQP